MESKAILAIIIVILLVLGVNGILYLLLRKGQTNQHLELWQRAVRRASNPWQDEENNLKELSKLVEELKEPQKPEPDPNISQDDI